MKLRHFNHSCCFLFPWKRKKKENHQYKNALFFFGFLIHCYNFQTFLKLFVRITWNPLLVGLCVVNRHAPSFYDVSFQQECRIKHKLYVRKKFVERNFSLAVWLEILAKTGWNSCTAWINLFVRWNCWGYHLSSIYFSKYELGVLKVEELYYTLHYFVYFLTQIFEGPSHVNVSHIIHDLSFGPKYPGLHNPLDGTTRILHDTSGTFKYYIKVWIVVFFLICFIILILAVWQGIGLRTFIYEPSCCSLNLRCPFN